MRFSDQILPTEVRLRVEGCEGPAREALAEKYWEYARLLRISAALRREENLAAYRKGAGQRRAARKRMRMTKRKMAPAPHAPRPAPQPRTRKEAA